MKEIDEILVEVIQKSIDAGDPPLATHLRATGLLNLEFRRYLRKEPEEMFAQTVEEEVIESDDA